MSELSGDRFLENPVISHPVPQSNFLSVFIPYPKLMDEKLATFCGDISVTDTLATYRRREMLNSRRIMCAEQFFSFHIDDSVSMQTDLLFTRFGPRHQHGFRGYLSLDTLKSGRHLLEVRRKAVDDSDRERREQDRSLSFEAVIPFWVE